MRGLLIGVALMYALGVCATAGGRMIVLWSDGWAIGAVARPAIEAGLAWPVGLAESLRHVLI